MSDERHSAIYEGWVRHRRTKPHEHSFRYRMFQLYLDLDELPTLFAKRWLWSLDRANLAQIPAPRLSSAIREFHSTRAVRDRVQAEAGIRPTGPIRLLTHGRYFGMTMNPVSFYYGFADDGQTLEWVLAEITNTPWAERHSLPAAGGGGRATRQRLALAVRQAIPRIPVHRR